MTIPGLGAFIATDRDAVYVESEDLFYAPGRCFTFNSELNISDGLLINSVSRSLKIDYDTASGIVADFVAHIKDELRREGEFTFSRIGRLELSDTETLSFIPFDNDRLTSLAGWLTAVRPDLTDTGEHHTQTEDETSYEISKFEIFTRFVRTFAGAAAAILLAFIVSTPVAFENVYTASTTPVVTGPHRIATPAATVDEDVAQSATVLSEDVGSDTNDTNAESEIDAESVVSETPDSKCINTSSGPQDGNSSLRFNDDDEYIVVVASLANIEAANKYISETQAKKNIALGMAQSGDYYRIYAATGTTSGDAYRQSQKEEIASYFDNAWVVRR